MSTLYKLTNRPEGKIVFTGTQDECVAWAAKRGCLRLIKDSMGYTRFRDIKARDTYMMEKQT